MDPFTAVIIGFLVLSGAVHVGVKATADSYATVKAAQSGKFDFIDANRQRKADTRQKLAAAWAERRRLRAKQAGDDSGTYRPGVKEYASDLYHGFWEDRLDRRSKTRAGRPEWQYDLDRKPWHVRFDEAVIAKGKELRGSRAAKAATDAARRFVAPVGEKCPTAEDVSDPQPLGFTEREAGEVAGLPGETVSRRFDGEPETDADRRFFDLRESGYDGWIDQDGHPVDGPAFQQTAPEPEPVEDDNAGWYDPAHLTGHDKEDPLVRAGRCPYQTGYGGWGDPYALCGKPRSPNEGDHPYCKPHAAQIRDDRGRGGYVAPAGDVDEHLPLEQPEQINTESDGGTDMTAPTSTATVAGEVNNNEDARRVFEAQIAAAAEASDLLAVYEQAQRRLDAVATSGLDGINSRRFDVQAQAAQANAADLLPASDMSQAAQAIEGIRASAEQGLAALDKYRDSEQLVNDNNVDGQTLETAGSV